MQMIGGNGGNQFRQYAGQNAGNLNGYNKAQNVRNQVARTQEFRILYTELLEPITESHQVPQNDNDVISEVTGVEQGGETVDGSYAHG
nr:hypothetical protein [Tanacetum cinerariifolium]